MTTDLKKWIEDLEDRITESVSQTVQEVASDAATLIENDVDPNRQKTRRSVGHRMIGIRKAVVGLFFAKRYTGSTRTVTHRKFSQTCRKIRPALIRRLIKSLNKNIQGE